MLWKEVLSLRSYIMLLPLSLTAAENPHSVYATVHHFPVHPGQTSQYGSHSSVSPPIWMKYLNLDWVFFFSEFDLFLTLSLQLVETSLVEQVNWQWNHTERCHFCYQKDEPSHHPWGCEVGHQGGFKGHVLTDMKCATLINNHCTAKDPPVHMKSNFSCHVGWGCSWIFVLQLKYGMAWLIL